MDPKLNFGPVRTVHKAPAVLLKNLKVRNIHHGVNVVTDKGTTFYVSPSLRVDRSKGRYSATNYKVFPEGWRNYERLDDLRRDLEPR